MTPFHTRCDSAVGLIELVSVDRVIVEIGEVRVEVQLLPDHVGVDHRGALLRRVAPRTRQAVSGGIAAVGVVDCGEAP